MHGHPGQFIYRARSDGWRNKAITRKFVINRLVMNFPVPDVSARSLRGTGEGKKKKKKKIEINFMEIHGGANRSVDC